MTVDIKSYNGGINFVQVNKIAKHVLQDSHSCQSSSYFLLASIVLPFNFFLSFSLLILLG